MKAPPWALRSSELPRARSKSGSADSQPLRNNVEQQHAEIDTPARGARLRAVPPREPPLGKRDGREDRQEYA